jgi:hypothetical protein
VIDLRWDNPTLLSGNTPYHVVGVNVYRSDSSDRGPFYRINEFPIGSGFYRDRTDLQFVSETVRWDVAWNFKGDKPNDRRFQFRTTRRICKQRDAAPYDKPTFANHPADLTVYIDDVEVPVSEVFGPAGEVTLINQARFEVGTESVEHAVIPTADSVVRVEYWAPANYVASGLDKWNWYRLTTVVIDSETPSGYTETPLNQTKPLSTAEVESMDYIWEEAVRRNQWILGCGGERVKLFIRKHCGSPCECTREDVRALEYSKQPENNCLTCYGTGFVGGYDGPFETIIAPDDAERRISQTSLGRHKEHQYEVWTGPSPLLTQRDFIVKQTNERYSVGPVRRPTHRGNLLQQHFNIGYLAEGDIRYRMPIDGTTELPWPETRPKSGEPAPMYPRMPVTGERSYDQDEGWAGPTYPEGPEVVTPLQTEKGSVPDHNEKRGRTKVWENTSYGISPISLYLVYRLVVEVCDGVVSWFL